MTRRFLLATFAVALLLLPSLLTAIAWTSINLLVSLAAISLFVALVWRFPHRKLFFLAIFALPIAIAPYPNWIWASNNLGWHFHIGYKLTHISDYASEFGLLYVVAALLLGLLAWAVRPNNSFKPKPLRGSA